jgi:hypothetical protein
MVQQLGKAPPILLFPSNRKGALVSAIRRAVDSGRILLLEPGTHFTSPGALKTIQVGKIGLEIARAKTATKTIIKRTDFSIPATAPDDNFGLFFVPARPSDPELGRAVWKSGKDEVGKPIEFDVFVGGSITIRDLTLDANMGRQKLESLEAHAAAHSAMLGFAPKWHDAGFAPDGMTPRRAYVVFRNITLHNLKTVNGGFADDILFTHLGTFVYPAVEEVVCKNIVSTQRVDRHAGTVTFAAPAATVDIRTANIFRLHVESDLDWKSAPRKNAVFTPSQWAVESVTAQFIVFSMSGRIMQLNAQRMTATDGCQILLLGGKISHGILTVLPGEESKFFRLDGLIFDTVTWHLTADAAGAVDGLWLGSRFNEPSVATFLKNKLRVVANNTVTSGQLINSVYSSNEPGNNVTNTFQGCEYEVGFGSSSGTKIARVNERGVWRFSKQDFRGLDPRKIIEKGPDKDVVLIIAPTKTLP